MGLSSKSGNGWLMQVITRCTCGRNMYADKNDLAVVIEQDGYTALGGLCKTSLVVCMRDGCDGKWRTNRPYMQGLPRIYFSEYQKKD